jgi:hypothetical protein
MASTTAADTHERRAVDAVPNDGGQLGPHPGSSAREVSDSFYVRRLTPLGRLGWTGSIRSRRQAEREAQAWRDAGWFADVLPNTPDVRKQVRAWQRLREEERRRPGWDAGIA